MKKTMVLGLAGALLAGLGTVAQAQTTDASTKPISIKLGAFFPSNGDARDAVGKSWFSAGAEYAFVPSSGGASTSNLVPLAYIDYAGKTNNRTFPDTDASGNAVNDTLSLKASYVGVGAGIRGSSAQAGSSITPYYGAGIGVYFLNATAAVRQGTTTVSDSEKKTSIGFKVNGGVEFSGSYFVEAAYTVPGSVGGTNLNGFSILGGARF